ncbi:hypothetical protein [Tardiphaga sp.]|jgi:hypothetical protein|uniref:hypothetical protein n=1 Tax=Tardiphaga sp. TaxID=1926292 RepID=UPI0037D9F899
MENIAADISGKGKDNLGREGWNPANLASGSGKISALPHSLASADFRAVDFPQ